MQLSKNNKMTNNNKEIRHHSCKLAVTTGSYMSFLTVYLSRKISTTASTQSATENKISAPFSYLLIVLSIDQHDSDQSICLG